MKYRPLATITLVLASFLVTFIAPIFDYSFYGENGHPTEWLSFLPSAPLRQAGLTLLFSPFLHINLTHFLTNMFFFLPVAMMVERKKSGMKLFLFFIMIHLETLLLLFITNAFIPLEGKAFLGSSHIVMGLYTYWALNQKKYGMMLIPLLVLSIGMWNSHGLTLLAHMLGFIVGVELSIIGRLRERIGPQSAN